MRGDLVLVFDLDDRQRARISAVLAAAGYSVRESANVADAAADSDRLRPGAVIVGLHQPQVDATLRAIAQVSKTVGPPADRATSAPDEPGGRFIGGSRPMRRIGEYLTRVAQSDATVLITGETGTGKELAAQRIHGVSPRRRGPFVSVNCAAIPETLLESELFGCESGAFTGAVRSRDGLLQRANRGTIFLDEVGDLALLGQAKLLRAIEAREIHRVGGKGSEKLDVRIVAATNQDLESAVTDGRFRKDLYFRLNVTRVHLPPLRERRSDIVPLLEHYLKALDREPGVVPRGFSPEAEAALQSYDWPGNVRELKNLVEAILVCPPADRIGVADLPEDFHRRLKMVCDLPETERRRLLEALLSAGWNKSKAAGLLHCSRMTLYRKMAKYSVVTSDELHPVSHRGVTHSSRKTSA